MESIMRVLQDGKARTARQILSSLPFSNDSTVNKKLVNSVLSSEAKRYVFRDMDAHTYRIRPANVMLYVLPPWDLVRGLIVRILRNSGAMTLNELKDELDGAGISAPKWMIQAILSDDKFRHSA